ncbi:MAG: M28 family peptidase [Cyanobacteria bacterium RM1_2_2]|nr:M28 family peptidase [Cyanobacteria bacterium RM1_2_2]
MLSLLRSSRLIFSLVSTTLIIGITGCPQSVSLSGSEIVEPQSAQSNVSPAAANRAATDVQALVSLGPRVAGTPVMDQASAYLIEEYRKAGYATKIQPFSYSKVEDQGSNLIVERTTITGRALNGSEAGNLSASLVAIPNVGQISDFEQVNVRGAIAIVERGEIRFSEKATNAAAAGAVGLIIVNNAPGDFSGSLGDGFDIPVLSLSQEQGRPLLKQAEREQLEITLNVNITERTVTGRNIIAHLAGVDQPSILVGGHYDSVQGSPGANDNASGTAVVLEMARNLANTPLAQQVWFVAFDGEEDGLHGSRAFVREADSQFLSNLKGMLNFDMVGINSALQASGTPTLTALVGTLDQPVSTVEGGIGGSDHVPFASADVPVLFFNRGQDANYHTPNDLQVEADLLNETTQIGLDVIRQVLGSR